MEEVRTWGEGWVGVARRWRTEGKCPEAAWLSAPTAPQYPSCCRNTALRSPLDQNSTAYDSVFTEVRWKGRCEREREGGR
jgi:hypothetical protein